MKDKYLYLIIGALIVANVCVAKAADFYVDIFRDEPVQNEVLQRTERIEVKKSEKRLMTVTAYSSIEGCSDKDCIMANGKKAEVGYIACPRSWKFGTKVKIENKEYECGDRLSMKYDGRIDKFAGFGIEAYKEAKAWGIKRLEVEIIKE